MPNELSSKIDEDELDVEMIKKDLESEDVFSLAF